MLSYQERWAHLVPFSISPIWLCCTGPNFHHSLERDLPHSFSQRRSLSQSRGLSIIWIDLTWVSVAMVELWDSLYSGWVLTTMARSVGRCLRRSEGPVEEDDAIAVQVQKQNTDESFQTRHPDLGFHQHAPMQLQCLKLGEVRKGSIRKNCAFGSISHLEKSNWSQGGGRIPPFLVPLYSLQVS